MSTEAIELAMINDLGPLALTGGMLSPAEAYEKGWQAATANQEALLKAALDAAAEVADVCDIQGEPYNAEQKIRQITPQQVMERMK